MKKDLLVSIIIPTYNRCQSLARALASLSKLDSSNIKWEIIVIDNNSNDSTKEVTENSKKTLRLPIKYFKVKRLSFTLARHTGAKNASGLVLIYIDDDVTVDKKWLKSILTVYESDPSIAMVGGPIKPIYEVTPPRWVLDMPGIWLSLFDKGPDRKEVEAIPGPNLSIRKSILKKVGGFPPDTIGVEQEGIHDTIKKIYIGPGDWGLCQKVKAAGYKIIYEPKAVTYHHIPPVRLTKKWWHSRFAGDGCYKAIWSQYEKPVSPYKLYAKSFQSLILSTQCLVHWIISYIRQQSTPYEFRTSYYFTKAKVEYLLARNKKLAVRMWKIGLSGILSNEHKKFVNILPH